MAVLRARGITGGMMALKHAPAGTPTFDAEAPGVGNPGNCCAAVAQYGPLAVGPYPELAPSGEGDAATAAHYRGYAQTST